MWWRIALNRSWAAERRSLTFRASSGMRPRIIWAMKGRTMAPARALGCQIRASKTDAAIPNQRTVDARDFERLNSMTASGGGSAGTLAWETTGSRAEVMIGTS